MTDSSDLREAFRELRHRNPALDHEILSTAPRRELATALVGLRRAAGLTRDEIATALAKDHADISRVESTAGELDLELLAGYIDVCRARLEGLGKPPSMPTDPE
ncbi:hypothetical protein [Sediminicurvatus halobius]|uniref:HTH cro/C1-type domain-containing protein n=1 Tax=Sediminicurvatus halobius TaxID=2182432 RepID=A0A2U2MX81_9GAMM|nr:hypothetical protein [Spiribacter halobius]PWG61475.1 hypothetical protein DEM34_16060 [Spiribacter halobius]UEX77987.1 hypothetical protein LMH63_18995 [Spiribacter halobius]